MQRVPLAGICFNSQPFLHKKERFIMRELNKKEMSKMLKILSLYIDVADTENDEFICYCMTCVAAGGEVKLECEGKEIKINRAKLS